MKLYSVTWLERHAVTVKAKDEEDARTRVVDGNYDPAKESVELEGPIEADES